MSNLRDIRVSVFYFPQISVRSRIILERDDDMYLFPEFKFGVGADLGFTWSEEGPERWVERRLGWQRVDGGTAE